MYYKHNDNIQMMFILQHIHTELAILKKQQEKSDQRAKKTYEKMFGFKKPVKKKEIAWVSLKLYQ